MGGSTQFAISSHIKHSNVLKHKTCHLLSSILHDCTLLKVLEHDQINNIFVISERFSLHNL